MNLPPYDDRLTFLQFTHVTPSFGIEHLLIRDAYRDIWKEINTLAHDSRRQLYLVTGTPGVGKSIFALYVLWRMKYLGLKNIVYQLDTSTFHFTDTGVYVSYNV